MQEIGTRNTSETTKTAIMINLKTDYNEIPGKYINLTTALSLSNLINGDVNFYGANMTVNYVSALFPDTKMVDNIPVMAIGNNDYLLVEMKLPTDPLWFVSHNLLLFCSYFYSSFKNLENYVTYATLDNSNFFTADQVKPGGEIKICITASQEVAALYKKEGYIISRIPSDYNNCNNQSTYNLLLRFGSKDPRIDNTPLFRDNLKISYYKYQGTEDQLLFTSKEIIDTALPAGTPEKKPNNLETVKQYISLEKYLDATFPSDNKCQLYPYLSNFTDPEVDYAIQSFYDSIELPVPINVQANNTQENYFMSDNVNIVDSEVLYLHILFANQNATGAALTSNIQIYNGDSTHSLINLANGTTGLIKTAPDLPSFSESDYPYVGQAALAKFKDYGIVSIKMSEIIENNPGLESVLIVERFSYNPKNLNYTEYKDCHPSAAYVGCALTESNIDYLKSTYHRKIELSTM